MSVPTPSLPKPVVTEELVKVENPTAHLQSLGLAPQEAKFIELLAEGFDGMEAYTLTHNTKYTYDEELAKRVPEYYVLVERGKEPYKLREKPSQLLSRPRVQKALQKLGGKEVYAKLRRSAYRFVEVIEEAAEANADDAADHKVRLKAAELGLSFAGYKPAEKQVNLNVEAQKLTPEEVEKLLANLD